MSEPVRVDPDYVPTAMPAWPPAPDGSLLVRVGAQVQAVLQAARTR